MLTTRIRLIALVVLCLVLLVLSARVLVAELYGRQALLFLQHWSGGGEEPSEEAWQVAASAGRQAVDWYPVANGRLLERLGRIHEWRYPNAFPGNTAAEPSREAARHAYRQALTARPYWPYTWARLGVVKMQLRQFDGEFTEAMARAQEFGPWRSRVNRLVVDTGLTAWRELSAAQRQLVVQPLDHLEIASPRDSERLYEYARRLRIDSELDNYRYKVQGTSFKE